MRVSLFEVWKITQRTLEGANVPDGHDLEGAYAVKWLAERSYPGFEMFAEAGHEGAGNWKLDIQDDAVLQASGSPLVSLGVDVVDYSAALAEKQGVAAVSLLEARGPAFLIPFAARRCANAGACCLQWLGKDGIGYEVTLAGPEIIWIDGGPDLCDMENTVDVTVTFDRDGSALRAGQGTPVGHLLNPETLAKRREKSLAEGVEIASDLWDRMAEAARAVLVPATDQSREMGAGGGNAND